MTSSTSLFLIVAIAILAITQALQAPTFSRRGFVSKVVTTAGAGAVIATHPGSAWAAPTGEKKKKKPAFRGGKEVADATHNGTELNTKEADVASGLLGKMGVTDIAPDKDSKKK